MVVFTVVRCVVSHFSCQLLTTNVFIKPFGWLAWFVVMKMILRLSRIVYC